MTNDSGNNNPFDFGKLFNGLHPFLESGRLDKMFPDNSWVEGYVQDMLKKTVPRAGNTVPRTENTEAGPLRYDIFETHRSVIVRVQVPESVDENKLRVFQGAAHVTVTGLPNGKKLQIALPAAVSMRSARCQFRDRVLEIRLRRDERGGTEREVYIEY